MERVVTALMEEENAEPFVELLSPSGKRADILTIWV